MVWRRFRITSRGVGGVLLLAAGLSIIGAAGRRAGGQETVGGA